MALTMGNEYCDGSPASWGQISQKGIGVGCCSAMNQTIEHACYGCHSRWRLPERVERATGEHEDD